MLRIFYGRENIDKDKFVYDHLMGRSILLVPDQFTLETEKDILRRTSRKGLLDVEVLGFSRFSDRILSECGRSDRKPITKHGRYMLLVKILKDVDERLSLYRGMYRKASFVEMTNDFLAQIRQNGITLEKIDAIKDSLAEGSLLERKLSDISIIYETYEEAIKDKYIDTENQITFVAGKIQESSFVKETSFWITGFDSFTPRNMDIIAALMKNAADVNIIMTYDRGARDDQLFFLTGSLIKFLKRRAEELSVPIEIEKLEGPVLNRPAGLETLERELYAIPVKKTDKCDGIHIVGAAGIYQEIETAASFISELVRDEGYRYLEIAVICNDLETNGPGIKRVFDRYGIPVFLDSKRKIVANHLIIYFMAYIRMAICGITTQDMVRLLKSGYAGYDRKLIDKMENYVIENRIQKNRWRKPFTRARRGSEGDLKTLNELREDIVSRIDRLSSRVERASNTKEVLSAIYVHLNEEGITEIINENIQWLEKDGYEEEAQITSQSWDLILQLMEQLDEIMGDEGGLTERIPDIIYAGIAEVEAGVLPPVCDSVSVGTAQRSRIASARAVVVIGADEGVFPKATGTETLLNDDELNLLEEENNITLARTESVRRNEEALGIYRTFAKASEQLWIGTAMADEKGDSVKPSPIIGTILRIFEGLSMEGDIFAGKEDMRRIAGRKSTLDHLVSGLRKNMDGEEMDDSLKEVYGWFRDHDEDRIRRIEEGLFYSPRKAKIEKKIVKELYMKKDGEISLSPSELENFARCPFAHFMTYGLKPQERRIIEMAPREVGDLYHAIFMELAKSLTEEGKPLTVPDSRWMTVTRDAYDSMIDGIVEQVVGSYGEGFLLERADERYRTERLKEIARHIGWVLIEHVRAGDIKDAAFEAYFGRGGALAPIVISAEGEKIYIEGVIDRMDILGNDRVKVIDYKTGEAEFSEEEAKSGWKIQLMVYLKAGQGDKSARKPGGTFYFHIEEPGKDLTGKDRKKLHELIKKEIFKQYRLDGAMVDDQEVIRSMAGEFEGSSDILPAKFTKDGVYTSSGTSKRTVFSDEGFEALQKDVDETIQKICEGIVSGDIDIRPKKKKKGIGACTYCRYGNLCGFDTAFSDCRYEWI